jgi:hypothetical protein
MSLVQRSDSNSTESRWSQESSFKVANASAVWSLIEPNSFSDASAKYGKVVRNPIKSDRQRDKGVLVDLDASFGFQTDLTQYNSQELMQGLFRAALRKKTEFGGAALPLLTVNGANQFTAASGLTAFAVNDLVQLRRGTKVAGNSNRLLRVTAAAAALLTVAETLVAETLTADALLVKVGVQTAAGDIDVDASQAYPALTSTALNFTTLGLTPGESIWIGGDSALLQFATNPVNNCMARIRSIAANRLVLDKCSKGAMITEAQAAQTIQLFFGRVLKNELGSLIIRPSYQLERQLNAPDDAAPAQVQSEYFTGAVYSQGTLNYNQADKITIDAKFMAADQETRTGVVGLKTGTRPAIETADAQNTTSNLKRVRLARVINGDEAPTPLVAFIKSATVDINNNDQPLKALTVLGAFEMSQGDFAVSGALDAYFASIDVIAAVRDNLDCTLDFMTFVNNSGWTLDMPLITLDDGSVNVSKDNPISIPLNFNAASGEAIDTNLDYTALLTMFDFLPTLAALPNS